MNTSKKLIISLAAAAATFGLSAPAFAGGYYGGHHGFHGGYYSGGYGYGHGRHYRRHRGHGGGGKAAAIALGVIGGAIILNEVAEDRARQRAYEDRYEQRYDRYSRRSVQTYDPTAFERGYEAGYARAREGDIESDGAIPGDDLDASLEGGRVDGGPEPIRFSYADAYRTCTKHARAALGDRGFILAAPAVPETAEDMGGAWKMTANVTAQDQSGDSFTRAMYCEADDSRVYLLELV